MKETKRIIFNNIHLHPHLPPQSAAKQSHRVKSWLSTTSAKTPTVSFLPGVPKNLNQILNSLNVLLVQQWAVGGHSSSTFRHKVEGVFKKFSGWSLQEFLSWLQPRWNEAHWKWSAGFTPPPPPKSSTAVSTFLENDFGLQVWSFHFINHLWNVIDTRTLILWSERDAAIIGCIQQRESECNYSGQIKSTSLLGDLFMFRVHPNSKIMWKVTSPLHLLHLLYYHIISWTEWSFAATSAFKPFGTNCRRKAVLGCPQWRAARLIS